MAKSAKKVKNRRLRHKIDRGQRAAQGRGGIGFNNLELPDDEHSKAGRGRLEEDKAARSKAVCEETAFVHIHKHK
ncbi:MAG: hypothetical protein A2Y07_07870 [Planctomycetes bacterium GWF2_50_10]|nr:MAG: hypothetical protein A2Y07_07870 [Planctomycetes bacterium GWF2_50_10]